MATSIQTKLLATKNNRPIIFYLLNGKEIKGNLKGFEQYSLTIENEKGFLETYYKHAILKICWGQSKNFGKVLSCKKEEKPTPENK